MAKNKIKNYVASISFVLLAILVIFLPFSSWAVSLTGITIISSLRDIIAILLLIAAIFFVDRKAFRSHDILFALLFIAWGILSILWRSDSMLQWLKGFRFLFGPVAFYLSLRFIPFKPQQKETVIKIILLVAAVMGAIALLDFLNLHIPLTTRFSGIGSLESSHFVGTLAVKRVQAVLAGPNALGLYLLVIFALLISWGKRNSWIIIASIVTAIFIVLTFSRSCSIALVLVAAIFLWQLLAQKIGKVKSALLSLSILAVISAAIFGLYRAGIGEQYLTHNSSSSLRYEQYQRIWDQKYQIGLLGRGPGTAGPSSLYRLDGGENHWTENTFLDIFEELGLIGLIIFLAWILSILIGAARNLNDFWSRVAFYSVLAMVVAGVFINFYTGQAGIWLALIFAGLVPKGPALGNKKV